MARLLSELGGEVTGGGEAGNVGNAGAAAGVDEDFVAFERFIVHGEGVRAGEARMSAIEMHLGAGGDLLFLALAKAEHPFVLLGDDFGKVHGDVLCVNAPASGVASVMSDQSAMHHGFGGRATSVDAGAAEETFLDEGHRPTFVSERVERGAPDCPEPMMMASYFMQRSCGGCGQKE